jgi:hypothetical protein
MLNVSLHDLGAAAIMTAPVGCQAPLSAEGVRSNEEPPLSPVRAGPGPAISAGVRRTSRSTGEEVIIALFKGTTCVATGYTEDLATNQPHRSHLKRDIGQHSSSHLQRAIWHRNWRYIPKPRQPYIEFTWRDTRQLHENHGEIGRSYRARYRTPSSAPIWVNPHRSNMSILGSGRKEEGS